MKKEWRKLENEVTIVGKRDYWRLCWVSDWEDWEEGLFWVSDREDCEDSKKFKFKFRLK